MAQLARSTMQAPPRSAGTMRNQAARKAVRTQWQPNHAERACGEAPESPESSTAPERPTTTRCKTFVNIAQGKANASHSREAPGRTAQTSQRATRNEDGLPNMDRCLEVEPTQFCLCQLVDPPTILSSPLCPCGSSMDSP